MPADEESNGELERLEEIPLSTEEAQEERRVELPDNEILSTYRGVRTDIRTAMGAQLSTCGLLLTLDLGAIYFAITESQKLAAPVPRNVIEILFGIAILLLISIALGLWAIFARGIPPSLDLFQLEGYLSKSVIDERRLVGGSTFLLVLSIILILFALGIFHNECYQGNVSSENVQPNILIIVPYQENITPSNTYSGFKNNIEYAVMLDGHRVDMNMPNKLSR